MIAPWKPKQKKVSRGAATTASTGAGEPRGEHSENGSTTSPLSFSMFLGESSGVSTAANQQGGRGCWFWGLVLFFFNRDRA